ncbi:class I SAM-dependent methyltransferase [Fictibacillus iocasae]|uniref:Class I SAM-dependent methyltransferase n=1 Tax=Fictibacillus iocasae TaxID=2715437 RepID=A0ABW2NSK9_9BACL
MMNEQYQNSENLDIRIQIHQNYSTNPEDWHMWLFDQYDIKPGSRILELGCGNGVFWQKNRDRVPKHWSITLSDLSEGMLSDTQSALQPLSNFQYKQINIEDIPFETNTFDVVIANHMLYHVPNRERGLAEVRRVLKDGGVFYSSTIGNEHMQEFGMLLQEFDEAINFSAAYDQARTFGLENGRSQLAPHFHHIELKPFPGDLNITTVSAVVDYLRSTQTEAKAKLTGTTLKAFEHFLRSKMDENGGSIKITKSTGLFASK